MRRVAVFRDGNVAVKLGIRAAHTQQAIAQAASVTPTASEWALVLHRSLDREDRMGTTGAGLPAGISEITMLVSI